MYKHYKDRIKIFSDSDIFEEGGLSFIEVMHDDDCPARLLKGDCTCDSDVVVETRMGKFSIDSKGHIKRITQ